MVFLRRLKAIQAVLVVTVLAFLFRLWAALLLPPDDDEPVYLQTALDYASILRAGEVNDLIDYPGNLEHPPLVKLLFALVLLFGGESTGWSNALLLARIVSVTFGTLAVFTIALATGPWAAGLLAIHTLTIKYTGQAYLEAVPQALSLVAVFSFLRVKPERINRWFWLSALALGATAAGKYAYVPVLLVVLGYLAVLEKKIALSDLLLYGLVAWMTFWALDVSLWREMPGRLYYSLAFHLTSSPESQVQAMTYPWYQPLVWMFTSAAATWHPEVFFLGGFDGLIAISGILGIGREWKERRYLVMWLMAGLLFLGVWPVKSPHYVLTVTPALCIMAAGTFQQAIRWLRDQDDYWGYLREMLPSPGPGVHIASALLALLFTSLYVWAMVQMVLGRVGWFNLSRSNAPLPGNSIQALLPLSTQDMLIATDRGAVRWRLGETGNQPMEATLFTTTTSGLPANWVTALARDEHGTLWFGTPAGLGRYDGLTWQTFTAADLSLASDHILSLAACERQVYVGTLSGAAFFDGARWHLLTHGADQPVFALACRNQEVWLATPDGVWQIANPEQPIFHPMPAEVRQFMFASDGLVWIATSGHGLGRWDGQSWKYFTPANSGLPHPLVNAVIETSPGVLWIGTSASTVPGGAIVRFDGRQWQKFLPNNSGASGAEVTAIALQAGYVWFGTRTSGIDLYQIERQK